MSHQGQTDEQLAAAGEQREQQQQQQQAPTRRQLAHRPSFAPPLPVPTLLSSLGQPPSTPLTNHEMYELIQKQQQQQAPDSPLANSQSSGISSGSFRQSKRSGWRERQSSIIVGTQSFRDRYGEYRTSWLVNEEERACE